MGAKFAIVSVVFLLGWAWGAGADSLQGVQWHNDLDSARRLAAETNRLVLVHFWSVSSEACRRMDRDVFARPDVAAAIQAHFVPVIIDAQQFPLAAHDFSVSGLPSDVVMTPQGKVLHRLSGGAAAEAYVAGMSQIAMAARGSTGPPVVQIVGGLPPGWEQGPPPAPGPRPSVTRGPLTGTLPADGNPPWGLDGYCGVSLAEKGRWVKGDRRWGVIYRGQTYLFAGPEEARRFYANPESYVPVASGIDLVAAVEQVQMVPGRCELGARYGGRIYLFASEQTRQMFNRDPERYVSAAPSLPAGPIAGNAIRRY